MSLITKTTLLYLLVALLVFGIGGVVTYYGVRKVVNQETDYTLVENLNDIIRKVDDGIPIDVFLTDKVSVTPLSTVTAADTAKNHVFTDTLAMHPHWKRLEPHRRVTTIREIDGQFYRISVIDVFIETDDIYEGVVKIMLRLFLLLGAALLVFSVLINRWLFRPFQQTLEKMKSFTIKKEVELDLPSTATKEFRQLNHFVSDMAQKARRDYLSAKEFSENASHEIQTPLSIAQGKLELLQEMPGLNVEQSELIQSAQYSLAKLSRLGDALLLLTKIDNKEFTTQEQVDFSKIVRTCLDNFEEIAILKGLQFTSDLEEQVLLYIDPVLADILVMNLVKNAIRHNVANGWVHVKLDKYQLRVENTGKPPKVPTQQLFERFQKSYQTSNSLGLGLSIVKKICEVNNLEVEYIYAEDIHQINVIF